MENIKSVPLAYHVDKILRPFRKSIPVIAAVAVSILFGVTILFFQMESDEQLLSSLSPHVSTLVETEDRPELQRLLKSIEEIRHSQLMVVEDGIVLSSTRTLGDLDRPFALPSFPITAQHQISPQGLITTVLLKRPSGPTQLGARLLMVTPLFKMIIWSLLVALFILNVGLFIGRVFTSRLGKAINRVLIPINELDQAIRSLRTLKDPRVLQPLPIDELENIRKAILEAHQDLTQAMEALAQKKAKEMSTDAYQRLIHDLHNPIRCLGNLVELTNSEKYGLEAADEASKKIPDIAEQILLQIESAKSNLDFEIPHLESWDIRTCIKDAAEEAKLASSRLNQVLLNFNFPDQPVMALHDTKLFRRAIVNIVKNSIEACHTQVRIGLKQETSESRSTVEIQIMDDGPGLTQEVAGLFLQGRKKSTKGDRQARGLAAANHIVRSHGGKIVYRPSIIGGACFEVRL